jgi:hypothetical protein
MDLAYIREDYETCDMNMAYLATNEYYPYLKDNPRYQELLVKMNL